MDQDSKSTIETNLISGYQLFDSLPRDLIQETINYLNLSQLSRLVRCLPFISRMIDNGQLKLYRVINNSAWSSIDTTRFVDKRAINLFIDFFLQEKRIMKKRAKSSGSEVLPFDNSSNEIFWCNMPTTTISAILNQDIDTYTFCYLSSSPFGKFVLKQITESIMIHKHGQDCYHQFLHNVKKIIEYIELFRSYMIYGSGKGQITNVVPLSVIKLAKYKHEWIELEEGEINTIQISISLIPFLLSHNSNNLMEFRQKVIAHKLFENMNFTFTYSHDFPYTYHLGPDNFTEDGTLHL